MTTKKDRRDYYRNYYQQKKEKGRRTIGLLKNRGNEGQLSLFQNSEVEKIGCVKGVESVELHTPVESVKEVLHNSTFSTLSTCGVNKEAPRLRFVENSTPVQNMGGVENALEEMCKMEVTHFYTPSKGVESVKSLANKLVEAAQASAQETLFANSKQSIHWPALLEIFVLVLISGCCLGVLTETVVQVDEKLVAPLLMSEMVAVFFSLTLAKWQGFDLLIRWCVIIGATILSNFLIIKSIKNIGADQILSGESLRQRRELVLTEIQRERGVIAELEARERFTLAKSKTKRVDELMSELKGLDKQGSRTLDQVTIWIQIAVRILLGIALILINHQISYLIVNKKFLQLVPAKGVVS